MTTELENHFSITKKEVMMMNDDFRRSSPPPPDDRGRRTRVGILASHLVSSSKTSRRNKDEEDKEEEIQSAEEWISSPGKVFSNRKKRYVITRESIEQFGKVTRDEQWIHKSNDDDDFGGASSSPSSSVLGGVKLPIAHGFFTVSLLTFLSSAPRKSATWCKYEINCGMKNVKFVKPVEVNSVLGCRTKVKSVSWKRGREMLETTYECEMFKEGSRRGEEEIVLEAEWIVRQVLA